MAGHPPVHQPERRLPVHRPATGILANGYPVPVAKIDNSPTNNFNPYTVMVAIGAGGWNNPTDADESFTSPGTSYTVHPPASNRMLVLADRQDSSGGSLGDYLNLLDGAVTASGTSSFSQQTGVNTTPVPSTAGSAAPPHACGKRLPAIRSAWAIVHPFIPAYSGSWWPTNNIKFII